MKNIIRFWAPVKRNRHTKAKVYVVAMPPLGAFADVTFSVGSISWTSFLELVKQELGDRPEMEMDPLILFDWLEDHGYRPEMVEALRYAHQNPYWKYAHADRMEKMALSFAQDDMSSRGRIIKFTAKQVLIRENESTWGRRYDDNVRRQRTRWIPYHDFFVTEARASWAAHAEEDGRVAWRKDHEG